MAAAILVIVCTAIARYAEPLGDTDLWWQMAYGRQLLENRTLVPDHSAFSWMPASNESIYCAWLIEIGLYLTYKSAGLSPFFIIRYIALLIPVVLAVVLARRHDVHRHPLVWLLIIMGLFASTPARHVKPEMASLIFTWLAVLVWMLIRTQRLQHPLWCYSLPLLMVIWVNSHGGFIFGCILYLFIGVGEAANLFVCRKCALPGRTAKHLATSLVLSIAAICITPYGLAYPLRLIRKVSAGGRMDFERVSAYASIFDSSAASFHYVDYMIVVAVVLIILIVNRMRHREVDVAVILLNVVFGLIYTKFLRSTYFWGAVFTLTAIPMIAKGPRWLQPVTTARRTVLGGIVILMMAGFGGRAVYGHWTKPTLGSWMGYGIGYLNPVSEADFIAENYPGTRLGNDYNSGAYLLWRLWPQNEVFIDSRSFPYLEWYPEYVTLDQKGGPAKIAEKYPAEIWCLSYQRTIAIEYFRRSSDWHAAFYGPTAAVFVHRDIVKDRSTRHADAVADIKNPHQAEWASRFALNIRDLSGAKKILAGMKKRFTASTHRGRLRRVESQVNGTIAYYDRDYEAALKWFGNQSESTEQYRVRCYQYLTDQAWKAEDMHGALAMAAAAVDVDSNNAECLYNLGILQWLPHRQTTAENTPATTDFIKGPGDTSEAWSQTLKRFLNVSKNNPRIKSEFRNAARKIIDGRFDGEATLIVPPQPRRIQVD